MYTGNFHKLDSFMAYSRPFKNGACQILKMLFSDLHLANVMSDIAKVSDSTDLQRSPKAKRQKEMGSKERK